MFLKKCVRVAAVFSVGVSALWSADSGEQVLWYQQPAENGEKEALPEK